MASSEESKDDSFEIISDVIKRLSSGGELICIKCIEELSATVVPRLGIELAQNVIIPLIQNLQFQEATIVLELLDCFVKLKPLVGGAEKVYLFLPIIQDFYRLDSSEVASKATDCLKLLFKDASTETMKEHFVPFIKRLANDHWPLTRAQTCGLFMLCYSRVGYEEKKDLIDQYTSLCEDDIPLVRMEVARHLGEIAKTTNFEGVMDDIVPIFVKLASDEHESVRHLLIDTFLGVAQRFIPRNVEQLLMPTMRKLFCDKSYIVRHHIASRFIEIQKAIGTGITKSDLLPTMVSLLQDPCPEVRVPAILKTIDFWKTSAAASSCEKQLVDDILPALITQALHPCYQVRIALCNIPSLSTVLGQTRSIEHLLPVLTTLMQDINLKVRLTLASHIEEIKDVTEIKLLAESFAALADEQMTHTEDIQERITGLKVITRLGLCLGKTFFNEVLTATYLMCLVHSDILIRQNAISNFNILLKSFGMEWLTTNIIPVILAKEAGSDELISSLIVWCINCLIDNGEWPAALTGEMIQPIIEVHKAKETLRPSLEQLLLKLETICDESTRKLVSECIATLDIKIPSPSHQETAGPSKDLVNEAEEVETKKDAKLGDKASAAKDGDNTEDTGTPNSDVGEIKSNEVADTLLENGETSKNTVFTESRFEHGIMENIPLTDKEFDTFQMQFQSNETVVKSEENDLRPNAPSHVTGSENPDTTFATGSGQDWKNSFSTQNAVH